jgi:cytidine deaminase
MCGYMMHFPFGHPKMISTLLPPNIASFIACGACSQIIYFFFKDHMHKTFLHGNHKMEKNI